MYLHSTLLGLQHGPLRDPCPKPCMCSKQPAALAQHSALTTGTPLQRALCPVPEPQRRHSCASTRGLGGQAELPHLHHAQLLLP